jgi:hypothetical protein
LESLEVDRCNKRALKEDIASEWDVASGKEVLLPLTTLVWFDFITASSTLASTNRTTKVCK